MHNELESKIAAWRKTLLKAMPGKDEPIAELEDHLRVDVARQMALGQTLDAAFAESAQRFGDTRVLADQFAQVVPNGGRLPAPILVAYALLWLAVLGLISLAVRDYQSWHELGLLRVSQTVCQIVGCLSMIALSVVASTAVRLHWRNGFYFVGRKAYERAMLKLSLTSLSLISTSAYPQLESSELVVLFGVGTIAVAQFPYVSNPFRWTMGILGSSAISGWMFLRYPATAIPLLWMGIAITLAHGAIAVLHLEQGSANSTQAKRLAE